VAPASSEDRAYCKLCNKNFSVSHGGQFNVKQHAQYIGHQQKGKGNVGVNKLSSYFVSVKKPKYNSVTACELGLIYLNVKHNHSYNSLDCGNKLASSLFHDSDIATKLCCGRTKSELLVTNVLAPKSL
jgi:hypothetical protein